MSAVYDLTTDGIRPRDLGYWDVVAFIKATDLWPGDVVIVNHWGSPIVYADCPFDVVRTIHVTSTGELVGKDRDGTVVPGAMSHAR